MTHYTRYTFGKNWQRYLEKHFSEERLALAVNSLQNLTQEIKGKTFLDIGCGSGIHSLAALRAGASRVTSFDYDFQSVAATSYLWQKEGKPENWTILQGSVLDERFMRALPKADIVYSWGVLHHTGDVWQALRNASLPLHENSLFCIALYSATCYENAQLYGSPSPDEWIKIKHVYNRTSSLSKRIMEIAYTLGYYNKQYFLKNLYTHLLSLVKNVSQSYRTRGMEYWTDIRDWLGGLPMQFVREHDCALYCIKTLQLDFVRLITGQGNTEYVFQTKGANTPYTALLEKRQVLSLQNTFTVNDPLVWRVDIPQWREYADSKDLPTASGLLIWEDGAPLSFPHCTYAYLKFFGQGRFRHWGDHVYFSTSDNSDPRVNGRNYTCTLDVQQL